MPMRIIIAVLTLVIASAALAGGYAYLRKQEQQNRVKELQALIDASAQSTLDLRALRPGEWDELAFWAPYQNICDLGIRGYEKGGMSCRSSFDDGECYLVFLRANEVAFILPVNRKLTDFSSMAFPPRLPREKAVFRFTTQGDWPKMAL